MAFPARLACILMLVLLSACATSDSTEVSSDAYNERVDEINRTWEEWRVAANACSTADAPCWEDALAASGSGFEQAVSDYKDTVRSLATSFENGECRSSLVALDAALEDLLDSLEALRDDVEAVSGIEASAPAVRSAWEDAVTAAGSIGACTSGFLEPTTDR
jgi:hypothetical protein